MGGALRLDAGRLRRRRFVRRQRRERSPRAWPRQRACSRSRSRSCTCTCTCACACTCTRAPRSTPRIAASDCAGPLGPDGVYRIAGAGGCEQRALAPDAGLACRGHARAVGRRPATDTRAGACTITRRGRGQRCAAPVAIAVAVAVGGWGRDRGCPAPSARRPVGPGGQWCARPRREDRPRPGCGTQSARQCTEVAAGTCTPARGADLGAGQSRPAAHDAAPARGQVQAGRPDSESRQGRLPKGLCRHGRGRCGPLAAGRTARQGLPLVTPARATG